MPRCNRVTSATPPPTRRVPASISAWPGPFRSTKASGGSLRGSLKSGSPPLAPEKDLQREQCRDGVTMVSGTRVVLREHRAAALRARECGAPASSPRSAADPPLGDDRHEDLRARGLGPDLPEVDARIALGRGLAEGGKGGGGVGRGPFAP